MLLMLQKLNIFKVLVCEEWYVVTHYNGYKCNSILC